MQRRKRTVLAACRRRGSYTPSHSASNNSLNIHLALLLVYSIGLIAIGLVVARLVRGSADFFVAGRRLSAPLIFTTVLASNIGAGATNAGGGTSLTQSLRNTTEANQPVNNVIIAVAMP